MPILQINSLVAGKAQRELNGEQRGFRECTCLLIWEWDLTEVRGEGGYRRVSKEDGRKQFSAASNIVSLTVCLGLALSLDKDIWSENSVINMHL